MDKKIRVTLYGSVINLVLPPIKFIAGIYGNSSALIADAVHSLSDLLSDFVVYIFLSLSNKPRDNDHDYGHGKYETIATLFISIMLICVGVFIGAKAVQTVVRYFTQGILPPKPSYIALAIAFISKILKEFAFRFTKKVAVETHSDAIMANAWHHRSDAYSSLATLIGVAVAILAGGIGLLCEPIAALVVAGFIVYVGVSLGLPSLRELSEEHLGDEIEAEVISIISNIEGVEDPHNLRTRRIGSNAAIEVDIRVDGNMTVEKAHNITMIIENALRKRFGQHTHIVIHVEPLKAPPHGVDDFIPPKKKNPPK